MKLISDSKNLILKEVVNRTSKKDNSNFQLVVLADMDNIEKFEFFLGNDLSLDGLVFGDKVTATIQLVKRGYTINANLIKLEKLKV